MPNASLRLSALLPAGRNVVMSSFGGTIGRDDIEKVQMYRLHCNQPRYTRSSDIDPRAIGLTLDTTTSLPCSSSRVNNM